MPRKPLSSGGLSLKWKPWKLHFIGSKKLWEI